MIKTKKPFKLLEQLSKSTVLIQVIDARAPQTTYQPI
jgi:ribosome biogenesis GTPase A